MTTLQIKLTNKNMSTCPVICNLHAPQRSPSISILRTHSSSFAMSVSSSHGFTSRIMFDLAIVTGSVTKSVTDSHHKVASSSMSTEPNNQPDSASTVTIDNRIYNTRLNTSHHQRRRKCHQFSRGKKWRTRRSRAAIGQRNTPHHSHTSGSKRSSCLRT